MVHKWGLLTTYYISGVILQVSFCRNLKDVCWLFLAVPVPVFGMHFVGDFSVNPAPRAKLSIERKIRNNKKVDIDITETALKKIQA